VLAFYGIYSILVDELKRYKGCRLAALGSHTACDLTSKVSGDIQIFKGKDLLEAIEIKLNKAIDKTVVRNAVGKIIKYNPKRYYILSSGDIVLSEKKEIAKIILDVKENHGCQIILNGLIPTLKYYFRLIYSLDEFVQKYSDLVGSDSELKRVHKEKWNELLKKNF
jgi:DNA (cytosine-5)-methyltransferase 1